MATVNFIKYNRQSAGGLARVSDYVKQEKKVRWGDRLLVSGINCSPQFSVNEFLATRQMYRKDSPVYFYHYTQSFHPDEDITGEAAHDLAKEFAERAWPGCEVLVATHTDAEHLHSHFIVNAVRADNGKMLRQGPTTLQHLRELSDELCLKYDYSVLPPQRQKRSDNLSAREYRSAAKGQSWKFQLMATIDFCMRRAKRREDFIREMERRGYQVRWEENRKSITYTTPTGMRCRDDRLHGEKYRKEMMEREFRIREEILARRIEAEELAARDGYAHGGRYAETGVTSDLSHGGTVAADGGPANPDREAAEADHRATGRLPGTAPSVSSDGAAGGDGEGTEGCTPDGGDDRTGWEKERAAVFAAQVPTAPTAPAHSGVALYPDGGGGLVGDLARLERSVDRAQDAGDVADALSIPPHTDSKEREKLREKRLALGHRLDDNEQKM